MFANSLQENGPTLAPANPDALPEARELLKGLAALSGKKILSGQHNLPAFGCHFSGRVKEITGHYPALWGQDFGFEREGQDGIIHRERNMEEARRQYERGSVITLMWHAVRPIDREPGTFKGSVQGSLTDAQWDELVTPGSTLWKCWQGQADLIAGYLKSLRDQKIPVLWRPYHEMNGGWFWWGKKKGPKGYKALWRMLYERFTSFHHLDNLLWVWNSNAPGGQADGYAEYYPGPDYVDILATDIYNFDYKQSHYQELLELAAGKPIALGEVGKLPSKAILEAQPQWVWFMVWNDLIEQHNTSEEVKEIYRQSRVVKGKD